MSMLLSSAAVVHSDIAIKWTSTLSNVRSAFKISQYMHSIPAIRVCIRQLLRQKAPM